MNNKKNTQIINLLIIDLYKKLNNFHIDFTEENTSEILLYIKKIELLNNKYSLNYEKEISDLKNFYQNKLEERNKYINSLDCLWKGKFSIEYINQHRIVNFEIPSWKEDLFLDIIKNIQKLFKSKEIIKRIILVDYCDIRYFDLFVPQILSLYCQILWIELVLLPLKPINKYSNYLIKENKIIRNFFWNKLKFSVLNEFELIESDLVIFNNINFYMYSSNSFDKNKYFGDRKISNYIFSIIDNTKKILLLWFDNNYLYDDILLNPKSSLFSRYKTNFFSKIIAKLNNTKKNNYEYDIVMWGSFLWRDYSLINDIIEQIKDIKICIINNSQDDIETIKKHINNFSNIKFVLNAPSYNIFYKYLNKSKIYLNSIPKNCHEAYWTTWLLTAFTSDICIISRSNKYFDKMIKDAENWYLYTENSECILLIKRLLNWDFNNILNVSKNNKNKFLNSNSIEDLLNDFLIL